jgi:hypothetical protein
MIGIAATLPRSTGGPIILRTLADDQCYTLTAVRSDCQRNTGRVPLTAAGLCRDIHFPTGIQISSLASGDTGS